MNILTKKLTLQSGRTAGRSMKWRAMISTVIAAASLLAPLVSEAAIITYTPNNNGAFTRFDYTVTAQAGENIKEFTIYFGSDKFSTLDSVVSPIGWNSIVVQPDAGIPADGFFDSVTTSTGITAGQTQGNFSASFLYFGAGSPGSQRFDIVDPVTFATVSSGFTVPFGATPPAVSVPEPATLGLFGLTLALLFLRRRHA